MQCVVLRREVIGVSLPVQGTDCLSRQYSKWEFVRGRRGQEKVTGCLMRNGHGDKTVHRRCGKNGHWPPFLPTFLSPFLVSPSLHCSLPLPPPSEMCLGINQTEGGTMSNEWAFLASCDVCPSYHASDTLRTKQPLQNFFHQREKAVEYHELSS